MDLSFFEIFAECSIAFAGFGAVHAALRGAFSPRGVMRAWTVVVQGTLSFFLSILPLLLALASLPNDVMWRSASAIGAVGAAATAYSFIVIDSRFKRLGYPPQATVSIRISQTLSVAAIILMLANLIGWPRPPEDLAYAMALVSILASGLLALIHSFLVPVQLVFEGEIPEDPNRPTND